MRLVTRYPILLAVFLILVCGASLARAAEASPVEGGWKGNTHQGFDLYFGVGGGAVTNVKVTFREAVCGKQSVRLRKARLTIDEAGHFGGAVIPNRLEFEGDFLAPGKVKGKIVSLETTGLPGCTRKVVPFTAHPRAQSGSGAY
jgi:hypothetical protein